MLPKGQWKIRGKNLVSVKANDRIPMASSTEENKMNKILLSYLVKARGAAQNLSIHLNYFLLLTGWLCPYGQLEKVQSYMHRKNGLLGPLEQKIMSTMSKRYYFWLFFEIAKLGKFH